MAWFPGAYDLRALSWAHVRVWGAAGRGCHAPASPGNAHFVCFPYVNRALFGISTSADRWPGSQARMSCAPCSGHMCASGEPLGAAATRRFRRGVRTSCGFPYVNRALFGTATSADRWPPCWPCMPCARYVEQLGASWRPPTAAVTRPDDRGVRVWHVQNAKSRFMLPMHSMGGTWSHGVWVVHGKECPR